MKRFVLLLFTALTMFFVATPALASAAFDPFGGSLCNGKRANSAVCEEKANKGNPISGPDGILAKITNIVAYVAGAAAIILIVISGIKYITSGGDPGKVSSAKDTLVNALIGLVVIVLARALIIYIVVKLAGT